MGKKSLSGPKSILETADKNIWGFEDEKKLVKKWIKSWQPEDNIIWTIWDPEEKVNDKLGFINDKLGKKLNMY